MADFENTKPGIGGVYPENADDLDWEYCEPLVTAAKLKQIHLFGLPLVSGVRDPFTNRAQVMTDTDLKEFIVEAMNLAELELNMDIMPKQFLEKHAFDKAAYDSFGYLMLRHRPVASIERLTVTPSNESDVFEVPPEWIDVGHLRQGQINLIPLTIALKSGTVVPLNTAPGGATFLSIFGHRPWIPSFWKVGYTAGFPEGKIPRIVNQLIGVVAAMEVLSMLATTFARSTSQSLSIDGASQSVSTPGPELYNTRLQFLGEKRKWLRRKLQRLFNQGIIVDNV